MASSWTLNSSEAQAHLQNGLDALSIETTETQLQKLLGYAGLIQKWNKTYNLTAKDGAQDILDLHILDALSVVPHVAQVMNGKTAKAMDVGSGGGLPGVVLAIMLPELQICCVDAVSKKTSFVQQVALELGLKNLSSKHARVETLPPQNCDFIISRAFASLHDFVTWTKAHRAENGIWLAMKGKLPEAEILDLPPEVTMFHVEPLHVPNVDAERHLLYLR